MSASTTFRHGESRCPQCGYKLDASTHVQGDEPTLPEPGDASICLNCGQVLCYEANCSLRKATVRDNRRTHVGESGRLGRDRKSSVFHSASRMIRMSYREENGQVVLTMSREVGCEFSAGAIGAAFRF